MRPWLSREPGVEAVTSERRLVGDEQAGEQRVELVARDDHVAQAEPCGLRDTERQPRRSAPDPRAPADGLPDQPDEIAVGEPLGAGCIERDVVSSDAGVDGDPGHVPHRDGLHLVAPVTRYEEQRQAPQRPTRCC